MDKIPSKANKLFDDARKKKNKVAKNVNKDSTEISTAHIADIPYKCCYYCPKAFQDSKFLIKHLLRRHSDKLISVYKNFSDRETNNSQLIYILKKEVSSTLEDFFSAKFAADEKHETEKDQATEGKKVNHTIKKNKNITGDIISNELSYLKKMEQDMHDLKEKTEEDMHDLKEKTEEDMHDLKEKTEKDMHNFKDELLKLNNLLKNEVSMKQDVNEKLALTEEKIMRSQEYHIIELRQLFLNELKSLLHRQQEISDENKSQLFELRQEIKRLEVVFNTKQQLTCTDSIKEEIKKELMPHIIPHVHDRKCERKKLKHSLSKTELSGVGKSHLKSPAQMSSHENFASKEPNSRLLKRHSENTFETDIELSSLVAEKLSQFSIVSGTSKLSNDDFDKKEKLLSIEKEWLSKKYNNFTNIYEKLNIIADQKAYSKLKNKKYYHKIKFAEPLASSRNNSNHSSFEHGIHEPSLTHENRNKQFSSTKMPIPSDSTCISQNETDESKNLTSHHKGARGDPVLPFSKKQGIAMKRTKLSPFREYETSDSIEDVPNSKKNDSYFFKR